MTPESTEFHQLEKSARRLDELMDEECWEMSPQVWQALKEIRDNQATTCRIPPRSIQDDEVDLRLVRVHVEARHQLGWLVYLLRREGSQEGKLSDSRNYLSRMNWIIYCFQGRPE